MKKIFAALLAAALVVSASIPAFAAEDDKNKVLDDTDNNKSADISASGSFVDFVPAVQSISFTVSWDSMNFQYDEGNKGTWNETTHKFEGTKDPEWSGEGHIHVENKSNVGIWVDVSFESAAGLGIQAGFANASHSDKHYDSTYSDCIGSAAVATKEEDRKLSVNMKISKDSPALTENGVLGTVSVTVSSKLVLKDGLTTVTMIKDLLGGVLALGYRNIEIDLTGSSVDTNLAYDAIRNALEAAAVPNGSIDLTICGVDYVKSAFLTSAVDCPVVNKLNSITLPDVTTIQNDAFKGCTALKSVNAPKLESIGNSAFEGCTSLTSITLDNVTDIGEYAFKGCTALTEVDLPKATNIADSAFAGCTGLKTVKLGALTTISTQFKDLTALESFTAEAATEIDQDAFAVCASLTSVTLNKVTEIGHQAFKDCTALTEVNAPQMNRIEENAFNGCTSLTNITLESVTFISNYAFQGCTALESLTFGGELEEVHKNWFGDATSGTVNMPNTTLTLVDGQAVMNQNGDKFYYDGNNKTATGANVSFAGVTFKEVKLASASSGENSAS